MALALFGMTSVFFLNESVLTTISQSTNSTSMKLRGLITQGSSATKLTSSCREYRKYPFPDHHSGLPYLGDVFASHDLQFVNFIGIHRGACRENFREADKFGADWHEGHRFMCVFQHEVHVISEYVHVTQPHDMGFIIRCKIPQQFQLLVGQYTTALHVDLHAIEDLEVNRTGPMKLRHYPSMVVTDTPALTDIPICHPTNDNNIKPNQFNMTAFTRIKSNYPLSHFQRDANASMSSPISRLLEWIDYHKQQDFDHFIIYDNDEEPHGPIERLLQPHIQSGLVTYRWFPLEDCWVDWGDWKGYLRAEGQMVASLAALHRFSFSTKFYAHMDVDEFFVPLQESKTVLDFMLESNSTVDAFMWKPTLMAPCNGTLVNAGGSVLEKWKCVTERHYADVKLIMRASRMLYFYIHYPVLTVDGTKPNVYKLNETTEGFLAHYRNENDAGSSWKDTYSGLVQNKFMNEVHFMDDFIRTRREKNVSSEESVTQDSTT